MPEFTVPDDPIDENQQDEAIPVDPLYERQSSLGLFRPSVILVGAGGVGCWTALALVLGGVEDITIFDGDTISTHNLNRFPLPEAMVGEMKSVALAHWLQTLRPKADIKARGEFDPALHSLDANWLVCCTDSLKSRQMCYKYATDAIGSRYLETGADGERWTLSPRPPEFSTEDEANPGYRTVPVHVGPCMMAGAAAAYYVLHDRMPYNSHSANWNKGPDLVYGDYSKLEFKSIAEEIIPEFNYLTCPTCHRQVEPQLIHFIKHLRTCDPNLGLREAKELAEKIMASPVPATIVEQQVHVSEVGDWTEEEVASHDEWAESPEGQAILNAANNPVAAARALGIPTVGPEEEDGQEQP